MHTINMQNNLSPAIDCHTKSQLARHNDQWYDHTWYDQVGFHFEGDNQRYGRTDGLAYWASFENPIFEISFSP